MASFSIQEEDTLRAANGTCVIDVRDFLGTQEVDFEQNAAPPLRAIYNRSLVNRLWRALGWLVSVCVCWVCRRVLRRAERKPVELPIGFQPSAPTADDNVEQILDTLDRYKKAWIDTSAVARAALLRECRSCAVQVSRRAAQAAVQAHGSYGGGCGEEWMEWIPVILGMKELEESLRKGGEQSPVSLQKHDGPRGGQYIANVFPAGLLSLLFPQVTGEVWLKPDKDASQGKAYRSKKLPHKTRKAKCLKSGNGKVAFVLGSGHQLSAIILDVLHKLFVDDEVVLLKLNPVNEFLGQYVAAALKPLILRGFFSLCYGPTKQGISICRHELVDTVRVTGSEDTYNAIVRGTSKTPGVGYPPLNKSVMVELGNVSPIIVVPGKWSQKDLDHHTEIVAASLAFNSGHSSTAAEVLVMDETWAQREDFLNKLRKRLSSLPQRVGWYPKSRQKQRGLQRSFPDIEAFGVHCKGVNVSTLPFLLVTGLSPEQSSTRMETWTTALQEVALKNPEGTTKSFLKDAVQFVNDSCWGSSNCTILVHPRTRKQLGSQFQDAIAGLEYGNIIVNAPAVMGFATTALPWGGYPGQLPRSIASAQVACVHNTMMFDHPEKSVLYYPFRLSHPAIWSPTLANAEEVVERAIAFIDSPSLVRCCAFYCALCRG